MIISSQRYLNETIVSEKQVDCDYEVQLVTVSVGGVKYDVVVDGHHSLEAAKRDGVEPVYAYIGGELQAEADSMAADDFLVQHYIDSDYYDVETGKAVWQ